ncbi:MAG: hypothetical protein CMI02_01905 [Oceanospirillaceae bacterium]|nr:hypothetical protein [Oceanospirillaceae bacterium]MBT10774.1 hypothetical protein [Oceanospirillaceae bacterium]|tara:strand:+ start:192388 stop:192828 length:441 start_codon:yes stop_codon:yes gene_type:complete
MSAAPFWQVKTLQQMTAAEWESLCDGCAKCCLHKLQDEDTDEVFYTAVHCRYMERSTCRCTVYEERNSKVPECVWLTPDQASEFFWLPPTCSYRLLAEGKDLPQWHPLITGDPDSVHKAGMSIRNTGIPDNQINEDDWQDYIIWKA